MDEEKNISTHEPAQEPEQTPPKRFLDRIWTVPRVVYHPVRKWVAILGIVLFIAMVIIFYATRRG